jgi:O-glycosyl hydrolase
MKSLTKVFRKRGQRAILLAWLSIAYQASAEVSLNVDFENEHQQIDHFGASDAWSINPAINKWAEGPESERIEEVADLLFSTSKGIGLSAWRFNIGAGSAEQGADSQISDLYRRAELLIAAPGAAIDTTKQTGQIRFLKEAFERGVSNFVAFSNSPPVWATKNGLAHPGDSSSRSTIGSTNLKPDAVGKFTQFLVDVVEYLRSEEVGVPVNYISPANEPTWEWEGQSQEANRYNMEDLKTVYLSLYDALESAGLSGSVQIDGAETVEYAAALKDDYKVAFDGAVYSDSMNNKGYGLYKNYINELLGDPEIKAVLGNHLSMHGYFSDAWLNRMGHLRNLTWQNLQEVSPGAKIWMSEVCILGGAGDVRSFDGHGFGAEDMDYALHVGKMIHRDLTHLNASAWHWWLALTPYDYKDGLLKVNSSLDGDSLQDSKAMWTLGNFSRFIRPGYRRIDLPGVDDLKGLMASAYKSQDEKTLVVVAINASEAAQEVSLAVDNLPANKVLGKFKIYVTNAENELQNLGMAKGSYAIPARSTVTLVAPLIEKTRVPFLESVRIYLRSLLENQ